MLSPILPVSSRLFNHWRTALHSKDDGAQETSGFARESEEKKSREKERDRRPKKKEKKNAGEKKRKKTWGKREKKKRGGKTRESEEMTGK